MPRIELRDGQWADLRERINHATDKEIKKAIRRAKSDELEAFDGDTVLVRAFVRDWNVRDPETGEPIPITDPDAIERGPDDIVEELARQAGGLWTGATVPNPSTPPSSEGSSSASQ